MADGAAAKIRIVGHDGVLHADVAHLVPDKAQALDAAFEVAVRGGQGRASAGLDFRDLFAGGGHDHGNGQVVDGEALGRRAGPGFLHQALGGGFEEIEHHAALGTGRGEAVALEVFLEGLPLGLAQIDDVLFDLGRAADAQE